MAIDDNTSYELTGAQVKDLANKIKGKADDNTFVGASSSAPGSKGLVPQPQAGDDTKFLAGDGSWQTVSVGGNYVTLGTNQNITGEKTFVGTKRIKFKGTASNSKLGFTAYDQNGGENGYLEVEGASNASKKVRLGCYDQNSGGNARDNYVGFQYYNTKPVGGGTVSYNLVCPPRYKGISGTNSFAYIPVDFTNGTTTVRAGVDGILNLSSLMPTVPVESYSTSEVDTGATWIDGKPIYKKTIDTGQIPSGSSTATFDISGLSLDKLVKLEGRCMDPNSGNCRVIPNVAPVLDDMIRVDVQSRNTLRIITAANSNWLNYSESTITLWYTKTTD